MKIDAHQHFWSIRRNDYGWLTPALPHLWREFQPAGLAPLLAQHGIDLTILVQAAPTVRETDYLLDIAVATPFVAGVVGWIDFDAIDAPAQIARAARNPMLVGLRPMVQDLADDTWLARAQLGPACASMVAEQLVFDALVLPRHLRALESFVGRHPRLPVVIDHCAKPQIRHQDFAGWRRDIARLARHPQVMCKLSGLVTEARPDWTVEHLRPVLAHVLEIFGPERLIWGSDWPVVTGASSYQRWHDTTLELLAHLPGDAVARIMGGNAAACYLRTRGRALPC